MLSRYALFGGRRRAARRAGETVWFVDRHGPALFLVVTAILALNVLDAFFTIYFLTYGGTELNPIVAYVLQLGSWPFILGKSLGIGVCILVLSIAKNFRAARIGLGVVLIGYLALLCWHLTLLAHMPAEAAL